MLNYIWLGLLLAAVLIGGFTGRMKELTDGTFDSAKTAVTIALGLIGIMALWLGMMRLAERSGLVRLIAAALQPLTRRLFPDVPSAHPANGAIVMTIAANMLGLSNAATPLGLRAMGYLETLNPRPGTATNAMCTFLAISTSSVQLIPATAVAILSAAGSQNPTAIIGTALIATSCAACAGIVSVKWLEKLPAFRLPDVELGTAVLPEKASAEVEMIAAEATPPALSVPGKIALVLFLTIFLTWFLLDAFFPGAFGRPISPAAADRSAFVRIVGTVSLMAIPFLLTFFPLYAMLRRVKVYEEFTEGAKEGFHVAVRIIPYLIAILVAVGMFRAAGGIDLLSRALSPVLGLIAFPTDLLPIVLVRPLSGSATTGLFAELVKAHGPDSLIARTAGTIMGSTETTFYVLAVYFGSIAIRRTRHAVLAGLAADLTGVIASLLVCRWMFR